MGELRVTGRPASPGHAAGLIHVVDILPAGGRQVYPDPEGGSAGSEPGREASAVPDPAREAALLLDALARAAEELRSFISGLGAEASRNQDAIGILGFQLAILQDKALAAPALATIAAGRSAKNAWQAALEVEIARYEGAEDEYFRARASDLGDVRDRVLDCLQRGKSAADDDWLAAIPNGALLVAEDLPPSRFLAIGAGHLAALLLLRGSPTSHVAMLARARGLPMVVGLEAGESRVADWHGQEATVDADLGEVVIRPGAQALALHAASRRREAAIDAVAQSLLLRSARTADGKDVRIYVNLADLSELDVIDAATCDGIGLARTEFLFQQAGLPDEETQYQAYRRMLEWAGGRTVTVRTLDAGGDKPIAGLTLPGESNPFLGVRGLRLSFARPDVFRVQLRALARAAVHGEIRMMVPMVTLPRELTRVRHMLDEELATLAGAGVPAVRPIVGMMVEVPAAAIVAEQFDAGFFSIGSNDLAQYVAAVGRDVGSLADLASPTQPAMLHLIRNVVDAGRRLGIETSLCGDAASDPAEIAALLGTGLRALSVAPAQLARVKLAVARTRVGDGGPSQG